MKVFISFDMEGVAGIVDWSQCRGRGRRKRHQRLVAEGR
jgi:D-aminopeptidase